MRYLRPKCDPANVVKVREDERCLSIGTQVVNSVEYGPAVNLLVIQPSQELLKLRPGCLYLSPYIKAVICLGLVKYVLGYQVAHMMAQGEQPLAENLPAVLCKTRSAACCKHIGVASGRL